MTAVLLVIGLLVCWALLVYLMYRGWRARGRRQAQAVGTLPPTPREFGALVLAPATGLYVGSTLAPSWQNRIAVGDLGFRANGRLSRFADGVLLERDGLSDIWIPDRSIVAIRTERGLAGKVMSKDGVLVIRWRPHADASDTAPPDAAAAGTEIDTGFRADDKAVYPEWVGLFDQAADTPGTADRQTARTQASRKEGTA